MLLLLSAILTASEEKKVGDERKDLVGVYGSVTESDCNVDLELLSEGKAKITQSCRLEDGSHRDVREVIRAVWFVTKGKVKVAYSGMEDLFEYHESLSYEDFGEAGSGPGLTQVPPIHKDSWLHGYGHLWKRPLRPRAPA